MLPTATWNGIADYYIRLPIMFILNTPRFYRAICGADVVLFRTGANPNIFIGAIISILLRKPFFFYFIGDASAIVNKGTKYKGWKKELAEKTARVQDWLTARLVRRAAGCFFLSSELANKFGRFAKNKWITFSSLVSNDDIVIRAESTRSSDTLRILCVSRLAHEKGIHLLIKAMAAAARAGNKWRLTICGHGPEREFLSSMVNDLGLEKLIAFRGFVKPGYSLSSTYINSDILVIPSISEGTPKVALEAMAHGVVVVASNVGGIPDIITHLVNGILLPPGSHELLLKAILALELDREMLSRIQRNGYQYITENTAEKKAEFLAKRIFEVMSVERSRDQVPN